MNAPVTRRALLGATAALGAVSVPALAEAVIPVSSPDHPDVELFRLLDTWGQTRTVADAAGERANALWEAFLDEQPPRPNALGFRGDDNLNCGFDVEDLPDRRRVAFYGLEQIGRLMSSPLPTRHEWKREPAPWNPREQVGRWVLVPDERATARRAEVLAAHHEWMAQGRVIKERLGMDEADEAENAACEMLGELEAGILATVPMTFAGLAAKARWATWSGLPRSAAELWARRVAADVIVMAERGGVAS